MLIIEGGEFLPEPEVIPTPSYGLNYILGGGLWTGRYHIIWGNPQAGKTTFALHLMADAQKQGYTPVIIDAEGSITDAWLEHCGIDISDRVVARSTRLEDIMEFLMKKLREKGKKYIFLIDSINTVVMEQFYKEDDSTGGIGIYARSQSALFQKLSDLMIESVDHMVICIAQQTLGMKGQVFVTKGKYGNQAEHWATNIIRLSATEAKDNVEKDKDERILTRRVQWKIAKSKQAPILGTIGDYWFSPETAIIDYNKEIFHLAVRNGLIERSGAWYSYGDQKFQGETKFIEGMGDAGMAEIFEELMSRDLEFETEES